MQIVSCVHHRLTSTDLTDIHTIRLMSDSCGGQNKNQTMLGMLCYWLTQEAPVNVKRVKIFYPMVGHSFLPPDRIFGRIEKVLRSKVTITSPSEYNEVFEDHRIVLQLGVDVNNLCWKDAVADVIKPPSQWHFRFAPGKRVVITRSKQRNAIVRGEVAYRMDADEGRGICRRGKAYSSMEPNVIRIGRALKEAKVRDIDFLLKSISGTLWKKTKILLPTRM